MNADAGCHPVERLACKNITVRPHLPYSLAKGFWLFAKVKMTVRGKDFLIDSGHPANYNCTTKDSHERLKTSGTVLERGKNDGICVFAVLGSILLGIIGNVVFLCFFFLL